MSQRKLFDEWPKEYDAWFETPIGKLIRKYECRLLLEMLKPGAQDNILDAGCGTGIFTEDILSTGANLFGLELSFPMLKRAKFKLGDSGFTSIQGDMLNLPFKDRVFDKTISVTAFEFIEDARGAVEGLFRATKPGGAIVVATLNSLSPWATRRKASAKKGHALFQHAIFRSPDEMRDLLSPDCEIRTAIHFLKDDDPEEAREIESEGQTEGLETGAFLVARWVRP